MNPHYTDTHAPNPDPERPSWILSADMASSTLQLIHPRAGTVGLRRRWRRTRRLRAARRAGWLVFVAAVVTLVQSGFGGATSSGASQPEPYTSQPKPAAGQITFYLALPAPASSLINDALAAAMPSSPRYRHFASVDALADEYGASNATMRRVTEDLEKIGLSATIDFSRLFARMIVAVTEGSDIQTLTDEAAGMARVANLGPRAVTGLLWHFSVPTDSVIAPEKGASK